MRKYLLAALAATAIASPAAARNGAGYIGLEGGITFGSDTDTDVDVDYIANGVPPILVPTPHANVSNNGNLFNYNDAFRLKNKMGYDFDLIGGYDFGAWRLEAELGWKSAKNDEVQISDELLADIAFVTGSTLVDNDFNVDSKTSIFSGMVNVLFDLGDDDGWAFYGGGGIGYAGVKQFGEKDGTFAWQLIAGARVAVSPQFDIGLKYKFFNTGSLSYADNFDVDAPVINPPRVRDFDVDLDNNFTNHSVLLSFIYNFAEPEPAPPPPPPPPPPEPAPPPPPPPATQTCPDGSTIMATDVCPPPPAVGERG